MKLYLYIHLVSISLVISIPDFYVYIVKSNLIFVSIQRQRKPSRTQADKQTGRQADDETSIIFYHLVLYT